ncbi:MAG: gliding motility-associated C-terminal domain-containing protein [Elusimicrobiota bacterium]
MNRKNYQILKILIKSLICLCANMHIQILYIATSSYHRIVCLLHIALHITILPYRRITAIAFLLYVLHFVLYTALYAANPDTTLMTVRPNFGPPTSVTNLVTTMGTGLGEVDINWTVPAEDPSPQLGELILNWPYHLRYSTNSLAVFGDDKTEWWNQASEYAQGWSEIGNGYGYSRSEITTLSADYYSKIVYFAIRAEDSGHYLATDFNVSSTTVRNDIVAPSPITDLTALTGNYEGEIQLQWTSPGDDETSGALIGLFKIKYAQQIITTSNYDLIGQTITIVANNITPGTQQSYLVSGLPEGATYYFAIKARDDIDNWSIWQSTADNPTVNINAFCPVAVDNKLPDAVTLSVGSIGFTSIELKWNAPTENIGRSQSPTDDLAPGFYDIRFSSIGAIPAEVAWNSVPTSNRRSISTSTVISSPQSYTVTGLLDKTTWWFCLVSIDDAGLSSNWSNSLQVLTQDQTQPAAVSNFVATPLYVPNGKEIQFTWTNPSDSDLSGVLIIYSTETYSSFNPVAGTNYNIGDFDGHIIYKGMGTNYVHPNLVSSVQYFYTAYAYDARPNYSNLATTLAIAPPATDRVSPCEPRGLKVAMSQDKNYLTISWEPVTKSVDNTTATDLSHYMLYRSTAIEGTTTAFALPVIATSTTTYTGGSTYHYLLTTHDLSANVSLPSARVDSSIDTNIAFYRYDNPKTAIVIPSEISSILYRETNSFGDNIYFDVVRLTSEETDKTIKSFAFLPKKMLTGEIVTGLSFSRAVADIKISYDVSNGYISAPGFMSVPENQAATNLSLFWFNGIEWVKVGGDVDTNQRSISVKSKKGGKYQLRQSLKAVKFSLTKVYPRIFTPNGDGWNDVVNFMYEGNDAGISGKIFDINGAFVCDMANGDFSGGSLKWNGKNANGNVVTSGIYIYQIEADKKVFNGTIVVAK